MVIFLQGRTIAAIATARGQAGVGIVRISGPDAIFLADKVFRSRSGKKLKDIAGYSALYGRLHESDGECLDEAVALVFKAPRSYTGEDVVEFQCHGGLYVTERVLKLVLSVGARLAGPGEFTERAFFNGKLDLTEAEAVMNIIGATGKLEARAALAARDGALSRKINKIKDSLLDIAARLTVLMDYPDEETLDFSYDSLKKKLQGVQVALRELTKTYDDGKLVREGIDAVLVGKPNVGKSTIMNFLSGQDRCIVTDVPGTTRDIVEESIRLGDFTLRISDTAGIRDTKDAVEQIGVQKAREKIKNADLVLAVFDVSRELSSEDVDLMKSLDNSKAIAILNKSDLKRKLDCEKILQSFKAGVYLSAISGEGLEELKTQISKIVHAEKIDLNDGFLFSRRQFESVKSALNGLEGAIEAVDSKVTLDAVAVLVEEVLDELLRLTGEKATESVVNEVFSRFCVGK